MPILLATTLFLGCNGKATSDTTKAPDTVTDPGDQTRPQLVTTTPSGGEEDVVRDTLIRVRFDEAILLNSLEDAPVRLDADGQEVDIWVDTARNGAELVIHPLSLLPEGADIRVTVPHQATDLAGNALGSDITVDFRTALAELVVRPSVLAGVPGDTLQLEVSRVSGDTLVGSELSFTVADPSVATVDGQGRVHFVARGTTDIKIEAHRAKTHATAATADRRAANFPLLSNPELYDVVWDLQTGIEAGSLIDGGGDRFNGWWALAINGETYDLLDSSGADVLPSLGDPAAAPIDALIHGSSWYSPNGQACVMRSLSAATASQPIDLTASSSATLRFDAYFTSDGPDMITGDEGWSLVLTDAYGADTSLVEGGVDSDWTPHTIDISAWAGQRITLTWEARGQVGSIQNYWGAADGLTLTQISVLDDNATEHFAGGDCASVDPAWDFERVLMPREVRFPAHSTTTQPDVSITRRFYAPYDGRWGRFFDHVTNDGASDVTFMLQLQGYMSGPDGSWIQLGGVGGFALEGDHDFPGTGMIWGNNMADLDGFGADAGWAYATWEVTLAPGESASLLSYALFGSSDEIIEPELYDLYEQILDEVPSGHGQTLEGLDAVDLSDLINW